MRNLSMLLIIILIGIGSYIYFNEPVMDVEPIQVTATEEKPVEDTRSRFEKAIEKPVWFNDANQVELTSEKDVSTLWQSKKRCCIAKDKLAENKQEFFKSCYNYINREEENASSSTERAVVKCLWLMDGSVKRTQRVKIQEYLLENYFYHDKLTSNCANCAPADTIVRVSTSLARHYDHHDNATNKAIKTLERAISKRSKETSLWVQVEAYQLLAEMYKKQGTTTPAQREKLEQYLIKFQSVPSNKSVMSRLSKFEKIAEELLR